MVTCLLGLGLNQRRNEQSSPYQLGHHLAFTKSDTAGEVMFVRTSMFTNQVFKCLSRVNRACLGLRQQYQK